MREHLNSIFVATRVSAVILLLFTAVATMDAGAQQVRIVADGTEIRLDPRDSSPVIVSMASGTLLDWVGESGDWYAVLIAGDPGEDEVIGYVLASQVEFVGSPVAPSAGLPLASVPAGGVPGVVGVPGLEAAYEAERDRRSSGVGKVIWGLVLIGGSYAALEFVPALQAPVPEDYDSAESYQSALDRRSTAESGRTAGTVLGAALGAWGVVQIGFGWRNMRRLALELPRSAAPSLPEQYADAFKLRASGKRKIIWAVFLSAIAYGAVEWVPFLGDPDTEDFDNAEDYNAAVQRRNRAVSARSWTYRVGAGLGGWGATQWVLGARKMSQIEGTARMAALSVPLAPSLTEVPIEFLVSRRGARTQFGIHWRR